MKRVVLAVAMTAFVFAAQGCSDPSLGQTESIIGQRSSPIVGGIADPNHRYVVSMGGCTGTVISKHTVLTAGHCYGSVSKVAFGPTASGATTSITISSKVRDPSYADICDQDATYDLTVVKLAEPAPTQAAPLLRATLDNTSKYIGPSWTWVGYGLTSQGGSSGTKRATTFPVDLVGPATGRGSLCEIPETLVYATSKNGRNACNGDSGGPSFWVGGGVEYLAGVTSSGDNACTLDDTQQRSDQPYIDHFIQAQIDANEGNDPCRSNGVCDETCNTGGQVGDPDCAANHCGADGICSEACVAPRDPDCASVDSNNCGDNGICDLTCASDPDCTRDCAAEGNCIPNCPTPDPDCAGQGDAGVPDTGTIDAGGGSTPDASTPDVNVVDAIMPTPDVRVVDSAAPDAPTRDAAAPDATTARDAAPVPDAATTRDAAAMDSAVATDAASPETGVPADAGTVSEGSAGAGPGTGPGSGPSVETTNDGGCSCRFASSRTGLGARAFWLALAVLAGTCRRGGRRRDRS